LINGIKEVNPHGFMDRRSSDVMGEVFTHSSRRRLCGEETVR
jgi:hypothetical protein